MRTQIVNTSTDHLPRPEGRRYTAAVSKIRKLLNHWIDSGVELFLTLHEVEQEEYWKAPGHASFSDFLAAEFPNALGIERYCNVIQAIQLHGEDFVKTVGVHSCHAITIDAIARHPERVRLLQESVKEHIQVKGVAPDQNKIRDIVKGIAPETVSLAPETRAVTERQHMKEQIRSLKARVKELEEEVVELRERLGTESPLKRPKKGTSRKAAPKRAKSKRRSGAGRKA